MKSINKGNWTTVKRLIWPRKITVATLALTSVFSGLLEAAFLLLAAKSALAIADNYEIVGIVGEVELSINKTITVAAIIIVTRLLVELITGSVSSQLTKDVTVNTRQRLTDAFFDASWNQKSKEPSGQLQHLLINFTLQGSLLMQAISYGLIAIASLLALLTAAFTIDPIATLIIIGALFVLAGILSPLRKELNSRAEKAAQKELEFANKISEIDSTTLEIETFGVKDEVNKSLMKLATEEANVRKNANKINLATTPVYVSIAYLFVILALASISILELGQLESFGAVMLVMLRSLSYGQQLQLSLATTAEKTPFFNSLENTLTRYGNERSNFGNIEIIPKDSLKVKDLSFEYKENQPLLKKLNFSINPGEKIGIVGPSGAGKTTLINLLLRLIKPTSGKIEIGEINTKNFSLQSWTKFTSLVPQETDLMSGSLLSNIEFFRTHMSNDEKRDALEAVQLDELLAPNMGYESFAISEGGDNLSGGQKQRVSIARSLAGNPKLLVLDEPTSALDNRSESLIRESLSDLSDNVTIIVVTHRISTLSICDRVMILDDGELIAFDSLENLNITHSNYRDLLLQPE